MPVTVVLGSQWGDEGKGKIVDLLSRENDIVVRYQGGPNAGHTIVVGDDQVVLHNVPSGLLHPGVICCLGNGCVIDPKVMLKEIEDLEARDVAVKGRFFISTQAHMIMPYHRALDEAMEKAAGKGKIGTTGKGIGPCYTDKYNRSGIRAVDLLNKDYLKDKLAANIRSKNEILTKVYNAKPLDPDLVITEFMGCRDSVEPFVRDMSLLLAEAIKEKKAILMEGAQGTLLDIDHGTYPFVTSSNPTAGGAITGAGIGPDKITRVLGVLKAYTTRVGNGPFPTEVAEPLQSQFRQWGGEFGSTTGRARRCGWLDTVIARYAARVNAIHNWMITKLDVLSHLDEILICDSYDYNGRKIKDFPMEPWILDDVVPTFIKMRGWKKDIREARSYGELPQACREYLDAVQDLTHVKIGAVSVGAERDATIMLRDLK